MEDRGTRITAVERQCERLENLLKSPVFLAGVLTDVLREQVVNNPQLLHPSKLASVLLGMIQTASPS